MHKSEFEKQVKSKKIVAESGEAATFKSTSGWQDGKYYCLHNGSTPGTIIKITNNTNITSIKGTRLISAIGRRVLRENIGFRFIFSPLNS